MSAKLFLEVLEKSGLLDRSVTAEIRQQVADSKQKISAESVAKALVEKGHLTKFQATKLIGEVSEAIESARAARAAKKQADDELLDLAPLDMDEEGERGTGRSADHEDDVVMLEDAGGLTPVEDAGAGLTPVGVVPEGLTPVAGTRGRTLEPSHADPFGGNGNAGFDPFSTTPHSGQS
ncbi:MAG: hypothetical protein AB7O38_00735, partial [Pirellulaceae bacterium]